MFIVIVGVGAVFTLVNQTISSNRAASSRLTAIYLAQEGIEIVRNIRDGNFLKIHNGESISWDNGIANSNCLSPRIPPCDFYGDANFDGVVSAEDWFSACGTGLCYLKVPSGEACARCNVNGDNIVNAVDFSLISAYLGECSQTSFSVCNTKAKFQRKTTITPQGSDILQVSVEVSWQEQGGPHKVIIRENLYKWMQ